MKADTSSTKYLTLSDSRPLSADDSRTPKKSPIFDFDIEQQEENKGIHLRSQKIIPNVEKKPDWLIHRQMRKKYNDTSSEEDEDLRKKEEPELPPHPTREQTLKWVYQMMEINQFNKMSLEAIRKKAKKRRMTKEEIFQKLRTVDPRFFSEEFEDIYWAKLHPIQDPNDLEELCLKANPYRKEHLQRYENLRLATIQFLREEGVKEKQIENWSFWFEEEKKLELRERYHHPRPREGTYEFAKSSFSKVKEFLRAVSSEVYAIEKRMGLHTLPKEQWPQHSREEIEQIEEKERKERIEQYQTQQKAKRESKLERKWFRQMKKGAYTQEDEWNLRAFNELKKIAMKYEPQNAKKYTYITKRSLEEAQRKRQEEEEDYTNSSNKISAETKICRLKAQNTSTPFNSSSWKNKFGHPFFSERGGLTTRTPMIRSSVVQDGCIRMRNVPATMFAPHQFVEQKFRFSGYHFVLDKKTPKCSKCSSQLTTFPVMSIYSFECAKCFVRMAIPHMIKCDPIERKEIEIIPRSTKQVRLQLLVLPSNASIKNNFEIQCRCYGKYSNVNVFTADVPRLIYTEIPLFSESLCKVITETIKNSNFLPLTITRSELHGKGVFATAKIPAGSLIMVYGGVVRTNLSTSWSNDSLFSLGYLTEDLTNTTRELLVVPGNHGLNAARFINSSGLGLPNCKAIEGLYQSEPNQYEPLVIIYSIQCIEPTEEILYDYGVNYFHAQKDTKSAKKK